MSKDKKADRREIFGFMMFDFANSSYTTIIITAVFNAYFVRVVVNQANRGELLWAITLSISYFIVMIFGPVLGAIADYSSTKKSFLLVSYLLCVVFTALLFFIKPGYIVPAMIFVIISNIGYSASENFVSSFLPDIADEENIGRISGYAWSFGYVGGLIALAICLIIILFYHTEGDVNIPVRLTNLVTAFFFGAAAIPTFLWVRERRRDSIPSRTGSYFSIAFQRLTHTFQNIRAFKELVKLLLSMFFFYSGIAVVISFAAIYAQKELGFTPGMSVLLIIVVNITAALGAFLFGFLNDLIGLKRCILITLLIWIGTVTAAYFIREAKAFWVIANIAGIAMGSSQSSARAMVGIFSPKSKSAEFFGFWGFSGKLSAIMGILSFGIMSYIFSSNRFAILSTIFYFLIGIIIMLFVREKGGREAALNYVDEV
ncbi:MAG: MFS transporter [Spirochaetota bacterium]